LDELLGTFSPDEKLRNLLLKQEQCAAEHKRPPRVYEAGSDKYADDDDKQENRGSTFASHPKVTPAFRADRIDQLDLLPGGTQLWLRNLTARGLKGDAPFAMRAFEECPEHA